MILDPRHSRDGRIGGIAFSWKSFVTDHMTRSQGELRLSDWIDLSVQSQRRKESVFCVCGLDEGGGRSTLQLTSILVTIRLKFLSRNFSPTDFPIPRTSAMFHVGKYLCDNSMRISPPKGGKAVDDTAL